MNTQDRLRGPLCRLCLLGAALTLAALAARADDWPQLRGPTLDGTVAAPELLDAVAVDFEEVWRRPLGSGYSAVAIAGQTAVTAATSGEDDLVRAFEALSGRPLWDTVVARAFRGRHGSDDGPSSSPTIGDGRVYSLHPSGRLVALDLATGELIWSRHLVDDFGGAVPTYGYSTAPLLVGDRLVMQAGGSEGRLVVALAPDTGELLWSAGEDPVPTEHQNPMFWRGPGGEQVVVISPSAASGYRLRDGEVLWTLELEGRGHAGDVTVVDERRLLLHRHNEDSRLIHIERQGQGLEPRVVWSTRSLDRTYAIPIVHRGHVYGFDLRFLVCLDLETGELLWKSRPPGGRVLSLIGDQLMVVNDRGELVAVAADSEGYRETGRTQLFGRRMVMTPVTYGAGLLFARNLQEIVALRPRPLRDRARPTPSRHITERAPTVPLFLRELLEEVGAGNLEAALAARYPSFPVVDRGRAHFLWIGEEPDVAVVGDMTHFFEEVALQRLPDTRVRWASFEAPAGERWEYAFRLYDEERIDPRNPVSIDSVGGRRSVVEMPEYEAWEPPDCRSCARGTVEVVEIEGPRPGRSLRMSVYLPAEAPADADLPLAILADGEGAQRLGDGVPVFDALIGSGEVEPIVVALLELPEALWYTFNRAALGEILDRYLLPHLEGSYRISRSPARRALISQRWAVDTSLLWATRSGAIALFATQSPGIGQFLLERELEPLLEDAPALRIRIDRGTFDQKNSEYGLDVERQTEELAALLRRYGHAARVVETRGGANWTRWREQLAKILQDFFPGSDSTETTPP